MFYEDGYGTANLKAELKEGHRGSGKTTDLITGKM